MKKLFFTILFLIPVIGMTQSGQPCPCGSPTLTSPVSYSFNIVPNSGNVPGPNGTTTVDCCKGTVVPGSGGISVSYTLVRGTWVASGFTSMSGSAAQRACCGEPS